MQTTSGAILLVIGVVALFAAIVGGGVKIREIEVGNLPSRWRQGFLAIFGIVVGIIGLIMVMNPGESGSAEAATQNAESVDQTDVNATEPAIEANSADQNPGGANTANANEAEAAVDNSGDEQEQQQ